jgi:hypothetical protein
VHALLDLNSGAGGPILRGALRLAVLEPAHALRVSVCSRPPKPSPSRASRASISTPCA